LLNALKSLGGIDASRIIGETNDTCELKVGDRWMSDSTEATALARKRVQAIQDWLSAHPILASSWVCIDYLSLDKVDHHFAAHICRVYTSVGITSDMAANALVMLAEGLEMDTIKEIHEYRARQKALADAKLQAIDDAIKARREEAMVDYYEKHAPGAQYKMQPEERHSDDSTCAMSRLWATKRRSRLGKGMMFWRKKLAIHPVTEAPSRREEPDEHGFYGWEHGHGADTRQDDLQVSWKKIEGDFLEDLGVTDEELAAMAKLPKRILPGFEPKVAPKKEGKKGKKGKKGGKKKGKKKKK
jgi:hypothetical protein